MSGRGPDPPLGMMQRAQMYPPPWERRPPAPSKSGLARLAADMKNTHALGHAVRSGVDRARRAAAEAAHLAGAGGAVHAPMLHIAPLRTSLVLEVVTVMRLAIDALLGGAAPRRRARAERQPAGRTAGAVAAALAVASRAVGHGVALVAVRFAARLAPVILRGRRARADVRHRWLGHRRCGSEGGRC